MIKINNPHLEFYIEDFDRREESDRIKLYDSDLNYLDYLPLDFDDEDTEPQTQYEGYLSMLESFETVEVLMDWLVCSYEFIGNREEMIRYLHEELNWDLPNKDYNPLNNEYVNRIGDIYVLISEF